MKRGLSGICYGFFLTLANPTRLAILELLANKPMNVSKVAENLCQEQSMISHNLKALERCNLISFDRHGKEKVYYVNEETVKGLLKIVDNHATNHCPFHGTCENSN